MLLELTEREARRLLALVLESARVNQADMAMLSRAHIGAHAMLESSASDYASIARKLSTSTKGKEHAHV